MVKSSACGIRPGLDHRSFLVVTLGRFLRQSTFVLICKMGTMKNTQDSRRRKGVV